MPGFRRAAARSAAVFPRAAWLALCGWLLSASPVASGADREIEIGIAPYLPSRILISNFRPMRDYLERRLRAPVIMITAPDYRSFHEHIRQRTYPLVITVANSAYLAHAESGYLPLLQPAVKTHPVLVVAAASTITGMNALRGQRIALPDPLALISMQAAPLLREAGLDPERDVALRHMPSHSAAVNLVLSGEAAAAVVSDRALLQLPAATREKLRTLTAWTSVGFPGVIYMASPDLPRQQVTQLTDAILEFTRDTPEGRRLMKRWGYDHLIPATVNDLAPFAPYGNRLREALAHTPETTRGSPRDEGSPRATQ